MCLMILLLWFPSNELSTSGTDGDVDDENAAQTKKHSSKHANVWKSRTISSWCDDWQKQWVHMLWHINRSSEADAK